MKAGARSVRRRAQPLSRSSLQVAGPAHTDFLAGQSATDEILTKAGAKNLRLIAAMSAGEASGSVVATWEADDWEAFGKVTNNFFNHGGAEVMEGVGTVDSPVASWQTSTYMDVR